MEGLVEELEAVQSIFSEELLVTERDATGSISVQYNVKGETVLTVKLNGNNIVSAGLVEQNMHRNLYLQSCKSTSVKLYWSVSQL